MTYNLSLALTMTHVMACTGGRQQAGGVSLVFRAPALPTPSLHRVFVIGKSTTVHALGRLHVAGCKAVALADLVGPPWC